MCAARRKEGRREGGREGGMKGCRGTYLEDGAGDLKTIRAILSTGRPIREGGQTQLVLLR